MLTVSGLSPLFSGMCFHISGTFDILSLRFNTLTKEIEKKEKLNEAENEKLNKNLKEFINLHNEYIELSELMSRTFRLIV